MRGLSIPFVLLVLAACRPSPDASTATTVPTVVDESSQPESPKATPSCAALDSAEAAYAAAELGMRTLQESRDGEHYRTEPFERAMATLRAAADQGHRGAQSLYGRMLFEVHFLAQAPEDEDREDYVAAFTFLRIAALRGDPAVDGYLPGLTDPQPLVSAEPLTQIPAEWLDEAYARADDWMTCYGQAAGDRGVDG